MVTYNVVIDPDKTTDGVTAENQHFYNQWSSMKHFFQVILKYTQYFQNKIRDYIWKCIIPSNMYVFIYNIKWVWNI